MKYLLTQELLKENIEPVKEPDYNDTKNILEQKQIEDLNVFTKVLIIKKNTEKMVKKL